MSKKKNEIRKNIEEKLVRERGYAAALARAKQAERSGNLGSKKRKSVDVLVGYIVLPKRRFQLRSEYEFTARTYNLPRQIIGLIDHLYGRYAAPYFLYRAMLTPAGNQVVFGDRLDAYDEKDRPRDLGWLLAAMRGESVAKAMSGVLTKKEAHYFLQAPEGARIDQNLFWAKCTAAGIVGELRAFMVDHLGTSDLLRSMGERTDDIIRFYATHQGQLRGYGLRTLTDFIRASVQEAQFSFKGRTYGSMVKLCQEWHNLGRFNPSSRYVSWSSMFGSPYEVESGGYRIRAMELTSSLQLAEEGKRLRHCVYTYALRCEAGYTRIVSIRSYKGSEEAGRLTVEVSLQSRTIHQVRGFANRPPSDVEYRVVKKWAGDKGLTLVAV